MISGSINPICFVLYLNVFYGKRVKNKFVIMTCVGDAF